MDWDYAVEKEEDRHTGIEEGPLTWSWRRKDTRHQKKGRKCVN